MITIVRSKPKAFSSQSSAANRILVEQGRGAESGTTKRIIHLGISFTMSEIFTYRENYFVNGCPPVPFRSRHPDARLPLHGLEAGNVADEIGAIGIDKQPAFEAIAQSGHGQGAAIDLAGPAIGFDHPVAELALDLDASRQRLRAERPLIQASHKASSAPTPPIV